MRGRNGVIDTTRLLRRSPFGEWVNVYYDPSAVTERQLLGWIRANRCPRAAPVRPAEENALLNAFAAPGDVVQLRVQAAADTTVRALDLPPGWKALGVGLGSEISAGQNHISVRITPKAKQGVAELSITLADGTSAGGEVAVVQQVGKH